MAPKYIGSTAVADVAATQQRLNTLRRQIVHFSASAEAALTPLQDPDESWKQLIEADLLPSPPD